MTGVEFKARFELAWDKPYSSYFDDTELNRIAEYSLYNIVERDYRNLQTQKQYDQITNLIKTNIPITLRSQSFHTSYLPIINVVAAANVVTVTTARPHFLAIADSVVVSAVAGGTVTNINGTFAVATVPSSTTFTYASIGSVMTTYAAGSGKIQTPAFMLTDYYHYLAIKASVPSTYTANISAISNASTTIDVTCENHNLRSGDTFTIAGVVGIAAANGTWTSAQYTILNKNKIRITGTFVGTYTSGGVVTVTMSEWIVPYFSDQKINTLNIPSATNPRVETQNGTLKVYPDTVTSVLIDYMATAPYLIDVTRTSDAIELYYPMKFIDLLIQEMVIEASAMSRDYENFQVQNADQSKNP